MRNSRYETVPCHRLPNNESAGGAHFEKPHLPHCFAQTSVAADVPCSAKSGPAGWRTFVDRTHRFCFQYPPTYKTIPDTSERRSIVALDAEGEIYVWLDKRPFKVEELEAFSRSGNPPEPTKIGGVTFYYVGPGGGGVFYPDDYFFNLRGKILHIEFDG